MTDILSNKIRRQSLLKMRESPSRSMAYMSSLYFPNFSSIERLNLLIHYIPDKLLLDRVNYESYLVIVEGLVGEGMEAFLLLLLDDLNNELVPRWIRIVIEIGSFESKEKLSVEDKQPNWTVPSMVLNLPL